MAALSEGGNSDNGKNRNKNWLTKEVFCLIEVWGDKYEDLTRAKRNRSVYEAISKQMKEAGYERTWKEVQIKIRNLSATYRIEKTTHSKSGASPSTWPFFQEVNKILCNIPHFTNPHQLESIASDNYSDVSTPEELESSFLDTVLESNPIASASMLESSSAASVLESSPIAPVNNRKRKASSRTNVGMEMLEEMRKTRQHIEKVDEEMKALFERQNALLEKLLSN